MGKMLTRLVAKNFKRFETLDIELGSPVVFVGPNDSGKTTALQALALWGVSLSRWSEKRGDGNPPAKRPGVTINRNDLFPIPVPEADHLWYGTHVRDVRRVAGKQRTDNIRIDLIVDGVSNGQEWSCGLELDYTNEQSFYCRPLRMSDSKNPERMEVPQEARDARIAYLPPMSGLTGTETRLDPGAINVRIGEGRTAEVLRNLCLRLIEGEDGEARWSRLVERISELFGIALDPPLYISERGEVQMSYVSREGTRLDLSSSGRGLQQTLLLMSYLMTNRGAVLLLDEPDAHLEILRQRQIYQALSEVADAEDCQIIAASHSEVVLNEAADRDVVIAFVGKPHRIDDRGSQVAKALKSVGFDQYLQAEQTGWVLYLEGSTDLASLLTFAEILEHPAAKVLSRPFVKYVANTPSKAYEHYYALREARGDLLAYALFDRLETTLEERQGLTQHTWRKRELENYLCTRDALIRWSEVNSGNAFGPLFVEGSIKAMEESIAEIEGAMQTLNQPSPWSDDAKVSDDFLNPLFDSYFSKIGIGNLMRKSDYHQLARHLKPDEIDSEVTDVLDQIVSVAKHANGEALPG
jgi:energy-coupling factor transporter ATP-binding protein EcfA2